MSDSLLPGRFLFHFAVPCRYREKLWTPRGAGLDETFRLVALGELEGEPARADVRAAWSEAGLAFSVRVEGKRQPLWCRTSRPEDSDGVQFWIDTRDVRNVHRAGRFCHSFLFLPSGGGSRQDAPLAQLVAINRAKEQPRPVATEKLPVRSQIRAGGYTLDAFLPAEVLTGFEPAEHPRLGFTYVIHDRELGQSTFGVGSPMPFEEDPSLWTTLELVGRA
jgi:hypothetical protein